MAEWKTRRFWREAGIVPVAGGFEVRLDGRVFTATQDDPALPPQVAALMRQTLVAMPWLAGAAQ